MGSRKCPFSGQRPGRDGTTQRGEGFASGFSVELVRKGTQDRAAGGRGAHSQRLVESLGHPRPCKLPKHLPWAGARRGRWARAAAVPGSSHEENTQVLTWIRLSLSHWTGNHKH